MGKRGGNSGEFERDWKSALSGAEATPPSNVWSEIDHSLTHTQLLTLQRKTATYKWTAAAALVIAASLGVMALSFNYPQVASWFGIWQPESAVVLSPDLNDEAEPTGNYAGFSILQFDFAKEKTSSTVEELSDEFDAASSANITTAGKLVTRPVLAQLPPKNISLISKLQLQAESRFVKLSTPLSLRSVSPVLAGKSVTEPLSTKMPDPASYQIFPIPDIKVAMPILNAESKTPFWSGIDIASGYFNPNYGPGATITSQELLVKDVGSREFVPELSENMRGGASYTIGINFGMQLKYRWSIEAGVNYSLLGARTFTNLILESEGFNDAVAYSSEVAGLESVANLVESELTKLSVDDIQINNTFQFMSFPVLAGYRLIDNRFNITLNAGLAANLYLGNHLRGQQNFSSFELEPGRRSPYRSLTLTAVSGFEIGYWIHRRVNLSFEPTYQKHLQSLTKNDAGFVSNPSGVGVQIGFKYDF